MKILIDMGHPAHVHVFRNAIREPEVVDIVKGRSGHEVGCHGYSHSPERGFDVISSIILSLAPHSTLYEPVSL